MAALTQAINKFWRNQLDCGDKEFPTNDDEIPFMTLEYQNLLEEIADVQIMLWQMVILLNADVDLITEEKLDRQLRRMEEENAD